ncbi:hypothetical protein SLOPH_904 [Spraguea lophii 42_110]|uniref:Uncharacterized protein n=1 Tax=Spraguea lophii (strain 42_110) TaxID=1358809 RepID=S7WB73_SPRLO|nr:hypothetical protein SLOPH_904 [Spraguea lophii 42_110]
MKILIVFYFFIFSIISAMAEINSMFCDNTGSNDQHIVTGKPPLAPNALTKRRSQKKYNSTQKANSAQNQNHNYNKNPEPKPIENHNTKPRKTLTDHDFKVIPKKENKKNGMEDKLRIFVCFQFILSVLLIFL